MHSEGDASACCRRVYVELGADIGDTKEKEADVKTSSSIAY